MSRWRLTLLGGFSLTAAGLPEPPKLNRLDQAFLCYLALAPRNRDSRDRLATLLWGDKVDDSARDSLNDSLWRCRKAINDTDKNILRSDGDFIALDLSQVDVDVLEFKRLATEDAAEPLARAEALYKGDLLDGTSVHKGHYEQWHNGESQELRSLAAECFARLATHRAKAGETLAAIEVAERATKLDEYCEAAHRILIEVHSRLGNRARALRLADSCEAIFKEAGIELSEETKRCIAAVRQPAPERPLAPQPIEKTSAPREDARSQKPRPWWWSAIVIGAALLTVGPVSALCVRYWAIPELAPAPIGNIVGYLKRSAGQLSPDRPSIAVLPFNSYGDDDAADYAEAISDGSAAALSIASEMRVVPRSSVMAVVANKQTAPREIARQLGVRYLLEGTVGKSGDRVSLQIDLIDTVKDQRVVTETFDREGSDIIALQEAITLEVITSLQVSLTEGEQERINRVHRTKILDAWLAAARGEKLLRHLTPEDNAQARDAYIRATSLDPAYAGAWEGLAWTYFTEARFGWTGNPAQSLGKAAELAQQTLALDPDRARTYSLLGSIALLKGEFAQAVELGEKAVELERNDADAAALLAYSFTYTGEPERAINLVERAIKLRPYPPDWYYWLLGRAKRIAGHDDEAISILDTAVRRQTGSIIPLVELAAAYGEAGNIARAKAIGARILDIYPGFSAGAWTAVQPYKDPTLQERDIKALRAAGLPQ
ncbi:MAG TPA: BTAD domain-containing putative transcriptional regulator [Dongiaceae bacterium]|nr:BTAD domain-containing putative transcriptional regulator [Dongiaceae bacterium]